MNLECQKSMDQLIRSSILRERDRRGKDGQEQTFSFGKLRDQLKYSQGELVPQLSERKSLFLSVLPPATALLACLRLSSAPVYTGDPLPHPPRLRVLSPRIPKPLSQSTSENARLEKHAK